MSPQPSSAVEGAIAFTDLVGFTEFTATRGDADALAVLGAQDVIVRAALPEGARVVKELGDGLLLFFPSADAAVGACVSILDGFERAEAAEEMPLWVRVGLHWGRPSPRGDDLVGHDVNVTARIVDIAAPGELLCSGTMLDAADAHDGVELVELGPVMMKGIPDPIDLYRVERVGADASPPAART
ncbi:MAG TPA: adenylate/guanylate cyclase domain-containing protein [Acidimicrobiia bacterium]